MDWKAMKKRKDFTLDVYGQSYRVKYVDKVKSPFGDVECCGLCDSETSTIYLNNKMDDSLTSCTVLHELFHAYSRRMGMENSGMSHELEEILADQFGKLLSENFEFNF